MYGHGMVSVWLELIDKVFIRKYCSLFESIHTFFNAYINISVGRSKIIEIVLSTYGSWKVLVIDAHIFRLLYRRSQKMILEIGTQKTSTLVGIRDGTVED